jgi:cell division protein FtsB
MSMPSEKSIHIASQCWCDEETHMIEMDTRLAMAFAKRLDVNYHAIAELTERNVALAAENENLKAYITGSKEPWFQTLHSALDIKNSNALVANAYIDEIEQLRAENAELIEERDAYAKAMALAAYEQAVKKT